MSTDENKGISKISRGGPRYFSNSNPGERGFLEKESKIFAMSTILSNRKSTSVEDIIQDN